MEEILASIRRIIEDNDGGKGRPAETDPVAGAETSDTGGRIIEVEAFRADLRTPPVEPMESLAPRAQASAPEGKPISLADVQAQVAAEAKAVPPPRWSAPTAVAAPAFMPEAQPETVVPEAESPVEAAPAPVAETVPQTVADDAESAVARTSAEAAGRPAILSERTERKVAAAFGELSEAFAARSRQTFDEMAEDMMRPMLQDWLDNNLPTLVERLVREEIERIARGS